MSLKNFKILRNYSMSKLFKTINAPAMILLLFQTFFCHISTKNDKIYCGTSSRAKFISHSPKYPFEALVNGV